MKLVRDTVLPAFARAQARDWNHGMVCVCVYARVCVFACVVHTNYAGHRGEYPSSSARQQRRGEHGAQLLRALARRPAISIVMTPPRLQPLSPLLARSLKQRE